MTPQPHASDAQRIGEIQTRLEMILAAHQDGQDGTCCEDDARTSGDADTCNTCLTLRAAVTALQRAEASAVALAEKEQEIARLQRIAEIKEAYLRKILPCSDCRDKIEAGDCQRCRAQRAESALAAERLRASEAEQARKTLVADFNGAKELLKAEIARLASQLAGVRTAIEQSVAELVVAIGLENQPGTDPLAWLDVVRDRLAAALPAVLAQPETEKKAR